MSRYKSNHWMEVMKIIQESGLHIWFSAESEWCFISSKGQRIKITPKINFSEAVEVVQVMKSARMIKFDEEAQKIKPEPVKTRGGGISIMIGIKNQFSKN